MRQHSEEPISVAILAGGQSRRMGQDKALLRLGAATPTFLELAINIAGRLANDIMVVGRLPLTTDLSARWLVDRHADSGPLAGIATALQESICDRCLILPCDHPFLSMSLLAYMASLSSVEDAVIPATRSSSRQGGEEVLQTLHALYRKECLPLIEDCIDRGDFRTTTWLERVTIRRIDEDTIRRFDPELLSFFSVNTPQDLERARTIAHSPAEISGRLSHEPLCSTGLNPAGAPDPNAS